MRLDKLVSALFVIACVLTAQDVDPGAPMLSRIKTYLRSQFAHLPNYTCLETVTRFQKGADSGARLMPLDTVGAMDHPGGGFGLGGSFRPLDTVRLEIACSHQHEWYGLPGDHTLSVDNPALLTGGVGLIANGIYSTTLHNLFLVDGAIFTSRGEDVIDGRKAVKFDYHFPAGSILSRISLLRGSGTVNERGSFWLDPQSLDLLRLDGRATEIPPSLPLAEMEFTVVYARTHIGEFDALLAQYADLHMMQTTGVEDYDRMDFTHCRMFQTTSTLRFDIDPANAPDQAPRQASPALEHMTALPASVRVAIQIASPITDRDAIGKLIAGRVVGDVRHRGKIVLENGSPVHGRIRRLARQADGDHFLVSLEFTDVQVRGEALRFYADLVSIEKLKAVRPAPRERVFLPNHPSGTVKITLPELPGVASFLVQGKSFNLPAGLRTVWRTRGLRDLARKPSRENEVMTLPPAP